MNRIQLINTLIRQHGQQIRTYDFDHGCGVAFQQERAPEVSDEELEALFALPFQVLQRDRKAGVGLRSWNESDLEQAGEAASEATSAPPPV